MDSNTKLLFKGRVLQLYLTTTIWNWCNKLKKGEDILGKGKSGRPKSSSKEEDAIIVKDVLKKPLTPVKHHRDILRKKKGIHVSLGEQGYFFLRPAESL